MVLLQLRTTKVSQPCLWVAQVMDVGTLEEPSTSQVRQLRGAWSEFLWLRHICFCEEGQVCLGLEKTR